jgi:Protein of unknown function (DUF3565)
MATPAVVITPVVPGAHAQKDAVVEVTGAVEADRCTRVGCVIVVAVGADRGRSTDVDGDLRIRPGYHGYKSEYRRDVEERFPSTLKELDAGVADGGHHVGMHGCGRWASDFHLGPQYGTDPVTVGFYRQPGEGWQEISFTSLSWVTSAHYDWRQMAEQAIVGFHRDEQGDWVAELECGHGQHVRHRPPWELRPWVMSEVGRQAHLRKMLRCLRCDEEDAAQT